MFLFLDDERIPAQVTWDAEFPQGKLWTIVRNIDEFKHMVLNCIEKIEHVAFDHDLGPEHYPWNGNKHDDGRTGLDCAKFLVDVCIDRQIPLPNFSVHSMNPCGRDNIRGFLENYKAFSQR